MTKPASRESSKSMNYPRSPRSNTKKVRETIVNMVINPPGVSEPNPQLMHRLTGKVQISDISNTRKVLPNPNDKNNRRVYWNAGSIDQNRLATPSKNFGRYAVEAERVAHGHPEPVSAEQIRTVHLSDGQSWRLIAGRPSEPNNPNIPDIIQQLQDHLKASRLGQEDSQEEKFPIPELDLRSMTVEQVVAELDKISGGPNGDFVLHGMAIPLDGDVLDPNRSNLGGKLPSIYATTWPEGAIFNAIFKKHAPAAVEARHRDFGEGASTKMSVYDRSDGLQFQMGENVANLIKEAIGQGPGSSLYREVFTDGYIQVLPKDQFTMNSPGLTEQERLKPTDHEFNTQKPIRPYLTIRVSPEMITDIIKFDGPNKNTEIVSIEGKKQDFITKVNLYWPRGGFSDSQSFSALAGDNPLNKEIVQKLTYKYGNKIPHDEIQKAIFTMYHLDQSE